jgi:hypothetical protein
VALLPVSGTIIESNAVLFDGAFFFLRPTGRGIPHNTQGLSTAGWGTFTQCLEQGGGIGADCNGFPQNGVRYDTPTFAGFSASGGFYEDDVWDVALKYAADWNSVKFSAAAGYTQSTDEGCGAAFPPGTGPGGGANCSGGKNAGSGAGVVLGGGGGPFQNSRREVNLFQVGASIMHVPSGLFVYGLYQHEENQGTDVSVQVNGLNSFANRFGSAANDSNVWYMKAGIKRTWTPIGATVLFGEGGQYKDQFGSLAGANLCANGVLVGGGACFTNQNVFLTGSTVNRWGAGIVQEIDSAAMHLWVNWQHLELDTSLVGNRFGTNPIDARSYKNVNQGFDNLDMFMAGGVIFF